MKLYKLRKIAAIKSHRGRSSLRLLAIKPMVQILARGSPQDFLAAKFLIELFQNRLRLLQGTEIKPNGEFRLGYFQQKNLLVAGNLSHL